MGSRVRGPGGARRGAPLAAALIAGILLAARPAADESPADAARRKALDEILDVYVRDGLVYYRALDQDRGRLDRYLNGIASADASRLSGNEWIAFWLNAYNALVLRTVIDHYPIPRLVAGYPSGSIRQIPGAFEGVPHRVGGRSITLDQIEKTILPGFQDPRVYFALGRGALGGGRLRSEAFEGSRLESQLAEAAGECVARAACLQVDPAANTLGASAIFSWHEPEFAAAYAGQAAATYASRPPLERAILAFIEPRLFTAERGFLAKNTFRLTYTAFDWSLNDLTGRSGR